MRSNAFFILMLLFLSLFLMPSCSVSKRTAHKAHDNTSVEEYEQKLYGKRKHNNKKSEAEIAAAKKKSNNEPNMPDAVDISTYEPGFKKDKKENFGGTSISKSERKLRKDMVSFGKKYVGVPYKYAGNKPSTGFDCSGFTCYIYQNFGMKLDRVSSHQAKNGKKVLPKFTLPGDLIIFGKSGKINHVGMVVENSREGLFVIHSTNRGVVVDNIMKSSYWKPRIMYGRRVVGK
jgi:cell wall-associated NlpC family hydrolase